MNVKWNVRNVTLDRNLHDHDATVTVEMSPVGCALSVFDMANLHVDLQNAINGCLDRKFPKIQKVIFNPPATIVFWADDTKTVVKCQNDELFDPEKGLAMAITKKVYGNKGNYFNDIKKWVEAYEEPKLTEASKIAQNLLERLRKGTYELSKKLRPVEPVNKTESVTKAYELLREAASNDDLTMLQIEDAINEAIGYLGEALDSDA